MAATAVDRITVADGYSATAFMAWVEPVGVAGNMPAFMDDASNSAVDQALQMGMHHDGMHVFALEGSRRGLLVMNHEYTDDGLLHVGGLANWSAEKVAKSQAAHGVSVTEIELKDGGWQPVRPSRYARRFTANTPFAIGGPAAGHTMMKTAADPAGMRALGTFNNCASGMTPWGTYLSGEENFNGYFSIADQPTAHGRPRRGVQRRGRTLRVHLQVRQPRHHQARWWQGQRHAAGSWHAVRGAFRRRWPWPLVGHHKVGPTQCAGAARRRLRP